MATLNLSISVGGTAQDALNPDVTRNHVEITAVDEDVWVNFNGTAAINTGELVLVGQSRAWFRANRTDITNRVSILAATTGSKVIVGYDVGV